MDLTVFVVTDGRSACLVFTDRDQAEEYERLSGNRLFECDVWAAAEGARFVRDYRDPWPEVE